MDRGEGKGRGHDNNPFHYRVAWPRACLKMSLSNAKVHSTRLFLAG